MKKSVLAGWTSGVLFGVGLVLSGMTDPANIKAFLDVTGAFDPSLALVMAGAVFVYGIAIRLPRREAGGPVSASMGVKRIDVPLVVGAGLFGVGWGLSGYCPGPSIVALGFGGVGVVVFVIGMLTGVLLSDVARAWFGARSPSASELVEQG
jgi:uncharacterized membrane protein YedE/YeeE